jgi:cytochrome P450
MIDFLSKEIRRNPFPVYEWIRRVSPVLYDPRPRTWMVFDFDGVKRVLSDHEAFSSSMFTAKQRNPSWFIFLDPPRHTKLRALVMRAFTPQVVANMEARIRELSRELLDRTIERGEMDVVADFAAPLPLMVIGDVLGLPAADLPRFTHWSEVIVKLSYSISGGKEADQAALEFLMATAEMQDYLTGLLAARREAPKDDLLTKLLKAEVGDEGLTKEEILGFFQLLLVGGAETTTNMISNAVLCLIENPDQLALLKAKPHLLPSAIEEVVRYRSSIQWEYRATRRDVQLRGQVIPAEQLVLAIIGSANRDPQQFCDPDRFDITRNPNPHIAFGHGIHFCLGAALSRMEGRIALADFLNRLENFKLASNQAWEPRQALHVHGPARLPIRFEPRRRLAASV